MRNKIEACLCIPCGVLLSDLFEVTPIDDVKDADVVITGEGRLDGQTVMGKAPIGVAKIAKKYGKPVIAFAGCVTPDAVKCNEHGIDAFFSSCAASSPCRKPWIPPMPARTWLTRWNRCSGL